jgi:hypothetical protein
MNDNENKKSITKERFRELLKELELKTGKSQLEIAREIEYLLKERMNQKPNQNQE